MDVVQPPNLLTKGTRVLKTGLRARLAMPEMKPIELTTVVNIVAAALIANTVSGSPRTISEALLKHVVSR